jgi:hypothetical protein
MQGLAPLKPYERYPFHRKGIVHIVCEIIQLASFTCFFDNLKKPSSKSVNARFYRELGFVLFLRQNRLGDDRVNRLFLVDKIATNILLYAYEEIRETSFLILYFPLLPNLKPESYLQISPTLNHL